MGLRFHVVLGLAGFSLLVGAGVYIGTLTQFGNPATCTSTPCLEAAGLGLAGYVFGHLAMSGIIGDLVRAGYLPGKRPKSIPQIGSGPEDMRILELANGLLGEIKTRRVRTVENIAWSDRQPWYWSSLRRGGFKKPARLVLAADLRGRLDLEDWKTLLSYYLLGSRSFRSWALLGIFISMALPLLVFTLIGFVISSLFGRIPGAYFLSILGPVVGLLVLVRIFPLVRKGFLKQDQLIAEPLGRAALLRLFRRIDMLKLPEIDNGKRREGWIARLWPMPNITERIENLDL